MVEYTRVQTLMISPFICCTNRSKHSLPVRIPTWSSDLTSYALPKDSPPSASRDHGDRSGILGQNFPLPAKEGGLESPRPPALIPPSGAGSPDHLDCLRSHFRRSFDWHRQPQSCARSGQNKVGIALRRPRQRAGRSIGAFS